MIEPEKCSLNIHLIPETVRLTNFGNKKVGDKVNIELDSRAVIIVESLARYIDPLQKRVELLEEAIRANI